MAKREGGASSLRTPLSELLGCGEQEGALPVPLKKADTVVAAEALPVPDGAALRDGGGVGRPLSLSVVVGKAVPLAAAELLGSAVAPLLPVPVALVLVVPQPLAVSDASAPEGDALTVEERLPRPLGLYMLLTVVAAVKLAAGEALGECEAVPE